LAAIDQAKSRQSRPDPRLPVLERLCFATPTSAGAVFIDSQWVMGSQKPEIAAAGVAEVVFCNPTSAGTVFLTLWPTKKPLPV